MSELAFPKNWLQNDSLGELISSELRLQIINGEIEEGSVLSENGISNLFETSRSPVREAFKMLEIEGLVMPGRMGVTVQGLDENDIKELYDVRFLLEKFCIQQVVEEFDQKKAKEFYKIIEFMRFHAEFKDYEEFAYQDLLFHEKLIRGAQHNRVLHFWKNIRNIILCLLLVATKERFKEGQDALEGLINNHRLLIDAMVKKDGSKINLWLDEHLKDTNATVMNAYLKTSKIKQKS